MACKCQKCGGKGWMDNPKYWNASRATDWYLQYPTRINCGACNGTGYVAAGWLLNIGDVRDAIDILKVYKNNPPAREQRMETGD